jgi:ABC-type Fe3+-siderophore transport system permease subunit
MNGIQSLASAALNLFREFVPGNPDVARFWLENGAATLSLLVVLGLLLRFFGSENARPGLLLLSGILGIALLAAGPSAIEIYALPNTSPSALAAVDTASQWTAIGKNGGDIFLLVIKWDDE